MKEKYLVALSGGVDSAAAAFLAKEENRELLCVTAKFGSYSSPKDAEAARLIAEFLGCEHRIVELGEVFEEKVIRKFVKLYSEGLTPNPCIDCNGDIKFGALLDYGLSEGCSKILTGHYARVEKSPRGCVLLRAKDKTKDQSYMLWRLDESALSRCVFPLGGMTKEEVRETARENGLPSAERPDSQDVCFVPRGDYAGFIERFAKKKFPRGDFVDTEGNKLGIHDGIIRYTVGQRRGLGIASGERIYVKEIDGKRNRVILCEENGLYSKTVKAFDIRVTAGGIPEKMRVTAKTRYTRRESKATLFRTGEDEITAEFDEPERAVCGGQSLVCYDGDVVVCGGIIR